MRQVDRAWNFYGSEINESNLKPICERVESHFVFPPKRLCRHFAAHDNPSINVGKHYRGFHTTVDRRFWLPHDLLYSFFRPYEETSINDPFEETIAFDDLIYVRSTICQEGGVGFVLTYAHELQHFIQHGYTPKLVQVNGILAENLRDFERDAITTDIPHEREANIVSKRVAEKMFGVAAVQEYAGNQILFMEQEKDQDQRRRWIFFRDVLSSTDYDLTQETLRLVEKYKDFIDFEIDVTQPNWWSS
jgi:hypothetical protein